MFCSWTNNQVKSPMLNIADEINVSSAFLQYGTIFAEWSNQVADASNSDISSECIDVDLRKIMDLDFLTDIEMNELIQKYIDRKHNTSSIQIDVKDMGK